MKVQLKKTFWDTVQQYLCNYPTLVILFSCLLFQSMYCSFKDERQHIKRNTMLYNKVCQMNVSSTLDSSVTINENNKESMYPMPRFNQPWNQD